MLERSTCAILHAPDRVCVRVGVRELKRARLMIYRARKLAKYCLIIDTINIFCIFRTHVDQIYESVLMILCPGCVLCSSVGKQWEHFEYFLAFLRTSKR